MEIGIIGAGRAGSALALALRNAGHRLAGVADRAPERAAALAALVQAPDLSPAGVARRSEVIFLSVPDAAIAGAAADLARELAGTRERFFFHLSGAHPAGLLEPLSAHGRIGSLHPLLALAEAESGADMLRRCTYAFEGDPVAGEIARKIVAGLGGRFITIEPGAKPRYHAAAVLASNCLVGLADIALELYGTLGLSREEAGLALGPLLRATLANLERLGPEAALTGPISRGDAATVRGHLRELAGMPMAGEVYRALGRAVLRLAARSGRLDGEQAKDLAAILEERTNG